ncbi:hypothetical protein BSKO_06844 [Bryopsis sp. KO-2023]|nr:hypothetical protein BSKO_06844 [Bryopsis sp. KO-2023]
MCDWSAYVDHATPSPDMLTTAKRLRESLPSPTELWTKLNFEVLDRSRGSNAPAWRLSQILRLSSDLPHCTTQPATNLTCAPASTSQKQSQSLASQVKYWDGKSHNRNREFGSSVPSASFSRIAADRVQWHSGTFSRDVESRGDGHIGRGVGRASFRSSSRPFCESPPKGDGGGEIEKALDGEAGKETGVEMLTVADGNVNETTGENSPGDGTEESEVDASSDREAGVELVGSEQDSEEGDESSVLSTNENETVESGSEDGESGEDVSLHGMDSKENDTIGAMSEKLADALKEAQDLKESVLEEFSTDSASVGISTDGETKEEGGDGEEISVQSKVLEKSLSFLAMGHTSSEESDSDDETEKPKGKSKKKKKKKRRLTKEDYKSVKSNTLGPERLNVLPPEQLRVDTRESLLRAQAMAEEAISRVKNEASNGADAADGEAVNGEADQKLEAVNGDGAGTGNETGDSDTDASESDSPSPLPPAIPIVNGIPPVIEDRKHEPLILMMIGCQGSGKTKFSLDLVQYGAVPWARINQDTLRGENYKGLRVECVNKARQLLALGYCVIIDRMNFDHEQRAGFIELTKDLGLTIHGVVFKLPYVDNVYNVATRTDHEGGFQGDSEAHKAIINFTRTKLFYRAGLPRQVDDDFSTVVRCESNEHYAAAFRQWVNYGRPMSGGKTLTMDMWKQMMSDKRSLMFERKPKGYQPRGPPVPMTPELQEAVVGYVPGRDGPLLSDTSEEEAEESEGE